MFKILIVEKDTKLRRRIKAILEIKFPFVIVTEASDAKETFKQIKEHRPEFILMDIRLERENGLKLAQKIKTEYPNTVIAINSNYDSPEYQAEASSVGADYFLSKTTNTIQDLFELVESMHFKRSGILDNIHHIKTSGDPAIKKLNSKK
jgi:two-component system response regulator YesN